MNTYTVDNQEVDISFTIFYRIAPDKVEFIFANNRDYKERLWSLAIDRLKAAMGRVNDATCCRGSAADFASAIKKTLIHDAAPLGIEVTDFQLTDLKYLTPFGGRSTTGCPEGEYRVGRNQRQQARRPR